MGMSSWKSWVMRVATPGWRTLTATALSFPPTRSTALCTCPPPMPLPLPNALARGDRCSRMYVKFAIRRGLGEPGGLHRIRNCDEWTPKDVQLKPKL